VVRVLQSILLLSIYKYIALELGGNYVHIVFDDANLEKTGPNLINNIFIYSGQMCSTGSRINDQEGIYDKVMFAFKYQTPNITVSIPFHESNFQGAIFNKYQFDTIMNYIL